MNDVGEDNSHSDNHNDYGGKNYKRADDTSLPSLECHPCLRQLAIWPACDQLYKSDAEIHKGNTRCNKLEWVVELVSCLADGNEYREYRAEANHANQALNPSAPSEVCCDV